MIIHAPVTLKGCGGVLPSWMTHRVSHEGGSMSGPAWLFVGLVIGGVLLLLVNSGKKK